MEHQKELGHTVDRTGGMVTMKLSRGGRALRCSLLFGAAWLLSCGIFSPRESEQPTASARTDAFNFKAIMTKTGGYRFTKLQYEDLFSDSVSYIDLNSGEFRKPQLIQKLELIQLKNPAIQVVWQPVVPTRQTGDTMYLDGLTYGVYANGDTLGSPDASGTSDFVVVRQDADWHIFQWRDLPASAGKSFFSPP